MDSNNHKETGPAQHLLDSGLASLIMLARFYGVAVDYEGLRHRFAPPDGAMQDIDIIRAAKALGLKAKTLSRKANNISTLPFPAMVQMQDMGWVIIGGAKESTILLQYPNKRAVQEVALSDFERLWAGRVLLISKRGFLPNSIQKFNISWFIPALRKYKWLFSEVLLLSFFLQLFGLVTPLFFQVVIDKVLVHCAFPRNSDHRLRWNLRP